MLRAPAPTGGQQAPCRSRLNLALLLRLSRFVPSESHMGRNSLAGRREAAASSNEPLTSLGQRHVFAFLHGRHATAGWLETNAVAGQESYICVEAIYVRNDHARSETDVVTTLLETDCRLLVDDMEGRSMGANLFNENYRDIARAIRADQPSPPRLVILCGA
jgi:hypothetical protein